MPGHFGSRRALTPMLHCDPGVRSDRIIRTRFLCKMHQLASGNDLPVINMTSRNKVLTLIACLGVSPAASAATIGGTFYAPQYDFAEFFTATDHRNFQVVLAGNPLIGSEPKAVARDLLPVMQAAKSRPALTFTYDTPVERPRPDYRLVLIFDPANDLNSSAVCNGVVRLTQGRPGIFNVYAVYCRNDQVMSETTGWTPAGGPTDPRIGGLFRQLFQVVFSYSPALKPNLGGGGNRQ